MSFVWHELNVRDVERARAFYGELLGWRFASMDLGPMGTYTTIAAGEEKIGGISPLEPGAGAAHWLPYVAVADVDGTARRVPVLGGKVQVPPTDIPDTGRFAVVADPEGAVFALFKPTR